MNTRRLDERWDFNVNAGEHEILRSWHVAVVIAVVRNAARKILFLYNDRLGKILVSPSDDEEFPLLGQWVRCKVVKCKATQRNSKRKYCHYKMDQKNWCTIQALYPTFLALVGRYEEVVISVPLRVNRGVFECEFFGAVSGNISTYTRSVLVIRACKGEDCLWSIFVSSVAPIKVAPHVANTGARKVSVDTDSDEELLTKDRIDIAPEHSSSPSFRSDQNTIHVVNALTQTEEQCSEMTTVMIPLRPEYKDKAALPESLPCQELYVGVVIQKRESSSHYLGSIIVIFARKIGIVVGMPSINRLFPEVGDWLEFAVEDTWVPVGDRISPHQMDNLQWDFISAPVPTYLNEEKYEIVIEIPVFVNEQGNLFSEFTGRVDENCIRSNFDEVVSLLTITECDGHFKWKISYENISSLYLIDPGEKAMSDCLNNLRSWGAVVEKQGDITSELTRWHPSEFIFNSFWKEGEVNPEQTYMGIVTCKSKNSYSPKNQPSYTLYIYNYLLNRVIMNISSVDIPQPELGQWIEFRAIYRAATKSVLVNGSFWRIVTPPVPTFFVHLYGDMKIVVIEIPIQMSVDGFAESLFTHGRIDGQHRISPDATKTLVYHKKVKEQTYVWSVFRLWESKKLEPVPFPKDDHRYPQNNMGWRCSGQRNVRGKS